MARYAIGIDLGTTHSAVSYFNLEEGKPRGPAQSMLPIPQLTAPGTVEARTLLPSFLYLPSGQEFPPGSLGLPWNPTPGSIAGEFARTHGAKVPTRLVSSAKSWLSHPGVDRHASLLPWQAPEEVQRISPVEASTRYLRHLREAWDHTFARAKEDAASAMAAQDVIITVPASFDAAARDLTLEAARAAGLENIILLEEPQAALYAWLEAQGESFRKKMKVGEVILVVDVGGGTSDFSLITVRDRGGDLELTRVAVGDHILLGGDNMDLALAHTLNQRLTAEGKKLDAWQFNALTYGCRMAKETLYGDPSLAKAPIAIPGRGSSLIGGTLRTELAREDLDRVLTDGFFPPSPVAEMPRVARRTGLAQMALPYAQDPAVTRHLAAFLTRQAQALANSPDSPVNVGGKSFIHPTAVLFNGGVFKAGPLKARVMEVINSWLTADGGQPAQELAGADLDLSVARGAAYYGWVRQGHGLRIRGGTARAYYVGVETAMLAVPGMEPPVKALCVAPFGMEEGTQADVPPQEFGLVTGEPTSFRFFASSVRRDDRVGSMVDDVVGNDEFEELAPIETTLPGTPTPFGDLTP
ncbi:Hsp70 family protein, partial [Archangium sp.]|uniref:Hsp70 family protein n=1 Tax=Archangium sp. TaxID=1872627 RepID=UPI002EDABA3E